MGYLLAEEELKPGMYCEVTIVLMTYDNSFLIPHEALQDDNTLYHVIMKDGDDETVVTVLDSFEILFEDEKGILIRFKENYKYLLLIPNDVKDLKEGQVVIIDNKNLSFR